MNFMYKGETFETKSCTTCHGCVNEFSPPAKCLEIKDFSKINCEKENVIFVKSSLSANVTLADIRNLLTELEIHAVVYDESRIVKFLKKKNYQADPEYQRYLELKSKFEGE